MLNNLSVQPIFRIAEYMYLYVYSRWGWFKGKAFHLQHRILNARGSYNRIRRVVAYLRVHPIVRQRATANVIQWITNKLYDFRVKLGYKFTVDETKKSHYNNVCTRTLIVISCIEGSTTYNYENRIRIDVESRVQFVNGRHVASLQYTKSKRRDASVK